jgi:hypothetical protein
VVSFLGSHNFQITVFIDVKPCTFVYGSQSFGRHSFVNRTIQLWNQLPADILGNLSCNPSNSRKKGKKSDKKGEVKGRSLK